MTRYNLVKFETGEYGVRRGWLPFFYEYHDFKSKTLLYWWRRASPTFYKGDCKTTYENAMSLYEALTKKETVIL